MAEEETQDSKELADLKNQVAMMTERQNLEKLTQNMNLELINSRIDLVKKNLPAATEKPLEGKTTMDASFTHLQEQVAYHALGRAAAKVADALEAPAKAAGTTIMVLGTTAFPSGEIPLVEVETQLDFYLRQLQMQDAANRNLVPEKAPTPAPAARPVFRAAEAESFAAAALTATGAGTIAAAALAAAPSVAGIVSEVAGYLRSDYEVKGAQFTMSRESLVASVTGKLRAKGIGVLNFDACLMDVQCSKSAVMKTIAAIMDTSQKLRESEIILAGRIAAAGKQGGEKEQKDWLEQANDAIKMTGQIQADTAAYLKSVAAAGDGKLSRLGQAILRENIRQSGISHLLSLSVTTGGGGSITRQERFWRSGRASFIGGAIVNYTFSTITGEVVASDAVPWLCCLEYDLSGKGSHEIRDIVLA